MNRFSERPIMTFALAGLVSGVCCGVIPIIGILLVPGGLFGISILFAICVCVEPLSSERGVLLVTGSVLAYLFALATTLPNVAPLFLGGSTTVLEAQVLGAFEGILGGFVLSLAIAFSCHFFRQLSFTIIVTFSGGAFGAIFCSIPHLFPPDFPVPLLFSFVIWQVGVAMTIGAYVKYSGTVPGAISYSEGSKLTHSEL